jgi:hypothetical protein
MSSFDADGALFEDVDGDASLRIFVVEDTASRAHDFASIVILNSATQELQRRSFVSGNLTEVAILAQPE